MQVHLASEHGLTSREAHPIANPNDKQSKKHRLPRPPKREREPEFDPLDDGDIF